MSSCPEQILHPPSTASHVKSIFPITKELTRRGHSVTTVRWETIQGITLPPLVNHTEIVLSINNTDGRIPFVTQVRNQLHCDYSVLNTVNNTVQETFGMYFFNMHIKLHTQLFNFQCPFVWSQCQHCQLTCYRMNMECSSSMNGSDGTPH